MLETLATRVQWYNRALTRSGRVEGHCSSQASSVSKIGRDRSKEEKAVSTSSCSALKRVLGGTRGCKK